MPSASIGIRKAVAYLDTNVIIDIAEARAGRKTEPERKGLLDLFKLLTGLVDSNVLACPSSTAHDDESLLSTRLQREVRDVAAILAADVEFLPWTSVLSYQAHRALCAWTGLRSKTEPPKWHEVFTEDPDKRIVPSEFAIRVEVANPEGYVHDLRQAKRKYADGIRAVRRQQMGWRFADYLQHERRSFWMAWYLAPVTELEEWFANPPPDFRKFVPLLHAVAPAFDLYSAYCEFTAKHPTSSPDDRAFWDFFESDEFAAVPVVDITCRLYAALQCYLPQRKPRPSDYFDLEMIATVLPYCDILVTDKTMKDLIARTGLNRDYPVDVFNSNPRGLKALCERLALLTRGGPGGRQRLTERING